jgi:hypothetical protein
MRCVVASGTARAPGEGARAALHFVLALAAAGISVSVAADAPPVLG